MTDNKHPRDERIEFFEEPHLYIIDKNKDIDYTSVTTFIHAFFPKFNPDEIIEKNYNLWKKNPSSKYYGKTIFEIKTMWKEEGQKASKQGTILHKKIEDYYNRKDVSFDPHIERERQVFKFISDHPHLEMYRTEWEVFDEELLLAGSIDMVFRDKTDDSLVIFDWKNSKAIKESNPFQTGLYPLQNTQHCNHTHYAIQLNLYKYILEKNYGIKIKDLTIVQFHDTIKAYKKYKLPNLIGDIDTIINDRKDKLKVKVEPKSIVEILDGVESINTNAGDYKELYDFITKELKIYLER